MPVNRRSYVGRVISAKMQNTLVVAVDRVRHHELYGKALRRKTILYVHDPAGESQYGDLVRVIESRPVSKTKRFRLQQVLQRHEVLQPDEVAAAEAAMTEATLAAGAEAAAAVVEAARAAKEAEAATAEASAEAEEAPATEEVAEEPVAEAEPEAPAEEASSKDEPEAKKDDA